MSAPERLSLGTVVRAASNQVSTRVGDDAVVLDLDRSLYYSLDEVGARIFELLQEPTSLGAVLERVLAEFEVDVETARGDLFALVDSLIDRNLVDVD